MGERSSCRKTAEDKETEAPRQKSDHFQPVGGDRGDASWQKQLSIKDVSGEVSEAAPAEASEETSRECYRENAKETPNERNADSRYHMHAAEHPVSDGHNSVDRSTGKSGGDHRYPL